MLYNSFNALKYNFKLKSIYVHQFGQGRSFFIVLPLTFNTPDSALLRLPSANEGWDSPFPKKTRPNSSK